MKKIILVYHQINEQDPFMSVTLSNFKKQIDYLMKKKFNFCNIEHLMQETNGNHVCIMFDDGYKSIIPAIRYLKQHHLNYSVAIIENKLNKRNYLSEENIDGTIYFHTKNHLDLTKLSMKQLTDELKCNYEMYSRCLVYPMGRYNNMVIMQARKKYKYALSLLPFHVTKKSKNYELPRICINGYLSFSKFKLFVSKLGNIYLHLAFFKRKLLKQDYLSK